MRIRIRKNILTRIDTTKLNIEKNGRIGLI
jgi:hypothetical protein